MFYTIEDGHPLPHNPLKAILAPRPIGWISTVDADGIPNLAPYSFFNAVSEFPPMVYYTSTGTKHPSGERKDTLANIRATGEFAVNIVSEELVEAMNTSTGNLPPKVDEFEAAGLEKAPCQIIQAPRVAASPANLECTLWKEIEISEHSTMVLGLIKAIHIRDDMLTDGVFDIAKFGLVTRLGYRDYATIRDLWQLNRPGQK